MSRWSLTKQSFESLLSKLNSDRERAAFAYQQIYRKLTMFFECRGCLVAEECADETINRVAAMLAEGRDVADLGGGFFLGVARNVLREHWRSQAKRPLELDSEPATPGPSAAEGEESEFRRDCLRRCLQHMAGPDREFIIEYYRGEKSAKIQARKGLRERSKVSPGQLRKKAFNVRNRLRDCVLRCLDKLSPSRNASLVSYS